VPFFTNVVVSGHVWPRSAPGILLVEEESKTVPGVRKPAAKDSGKEEIAPSKRARVALNPH